MDENVNGPRRAADLARAFDDHRRGKSMSAEALCRAILAEEPDNSGALHLLGIVAVEAGEAAQGVALIEAALRGEPKDGAKHCDLGWALARLGRREEALAAFDRAIALDPALAQAYNNRGQTLHALNRHEAALQDLERACVCAPHFAPAHYNRGVTLHALARYAEAIISFDAAIALNPLYSSALNNRGLAYMALKQYDRALEDFNAALALRPYHGPTHFNRGLSLAALRRLAEAVESHRRARTLAPELANAYFSEGLALLTLGRFGEGWPLYEWRAKRAGARAEIATDRPRWNGADPLAGKTIFLHWEQGYGDTIQAIRYAPLLAQEGAHVVVSVQQSLVRLLRRSITDIEVIGENERPPAFDYHLPLMSMPLAFATRLDTVPAAPAYLTSHLPLKRELGARLPGPDKLRIGIAWAGSASHVTDRDRSIPLAQLAPLFTFDARWIALQKDLRSGDSDLLKSFGEVRSFPELLDDFADTAALINELDLVISVDTSVAHLAGALGKRVWIMLPHASDWRWLMAREDSPWYPSAWLCRQGDDANWAPVIAQVRARLDMFTR